MSSRNLVLVAGMHRSGTSALTRAINLAGVPLPSHLMKPSSSNADGFWEPIAIMQLHEAVLKSINSRWDDPREIPEEWFKSPPFERFRPGLREWIEREFGDREMLLVKDPRICRLLPMWQDACASLGIGVHTVIPARNPIEVARSLKTRNGFPEEASYLLWLRHYLDAERFTRGRSRSFVLYDRLMSDRLATVRRIAADLGLTFGVSDAELTVLLGDALKPSLRHHVVTDDELAATGTRIPSLLSVWKWAQEAGTGTTPDPAPLDRVTVLMRKFEQQQMAGAR